MDGVTSIPLPGGAYGGVSYSPNKAVGSPPSRPFFVGPENRLVEVAVRAVLEDSAEGAVRYNPLLLHGPPGTGKTHLAQGVAATFQTRHGGRAVVCVTGIDFAREWADALETQSIEEFRGRYRRARLLVIEDVTRLADKNAAQVELLSTLDAALAAGARVVATAPTVAGRWSGVLPALQSRLGAGLVVALTSPGRETRLAILRHEARERGIALPEAVGAILAEALDAPAGELIAALLQLQMRANLAGSPITLEMARKFIAERQHSRNVDVADIATATARSFALKVSQLRGRCRRRDVVAARGVAMYLARQLTDKTLEQIGEFFGGRDHTTVLHGCRKTAALMETEPEIQEAVQRVHHGLQIA